MTSHTKKIIVIKFGGNALTNETGRAFCQTVARLPEMGYAPIIVHGGGPQINAMLDALNVKSHFVNGLRFTDEDTLAVAEMVLSGQVGKMLVQFLNNENVPAVGVSGKDGKMLIAEKMTQDDHGNAIGLGFVGHIQSANPRLLNALTDNGFIPVVAPLAHGQDGHTYNINADYAAAAIAEAVCAQHFIVMTNIEGLLDAQQQIIRRATTADINQLIKDGVIQGGMIPKTLSAVDTLDRVGEVNIIDGRNADNLIALLSYQTIGTTIVR
ncbi:MAG: acetylglutamate kinase [Gammaproteobacteria bacterium]|nr:MAG: acetylglutamate kinase [Gammaproteobacteria bacterium]